MYISLPLSHAAAQSADAFYADRENLKSAKHAAELWSSEMQRDASAFEPSWKLARICYWLGGHAQEQERRGYLEKGIAAATQATRLEPNRPEGHFWTAANMGTLAEDFGLRQGLKYRKPVREELETVLRLAPGFMNGGADRALGRYYFEVPSLFGGSDKLAEQHLRASLRYDADNSLSLYFLAELLVDQKRTAEARAELQHLLGAPLSAEWAPEDRDNKRRAAELLATLR